MDRQYHNIVVISGPNGSGKSTTAPSLLKGALSVTEFVNADIIAQGLSAFKPEDAAFHAGRVMLERIHTLAKEKADFAFETTLSNRTFGPWIKELKKNGYIFHLVFLWLPSEEIAVKRVEERVRLGGHNVPEETIRRRYKKGLENFFKIYKPLSETWRIYNNSDFSGPELIAEGKGYFKEKVYNPNIWKGIKEKYND